MFKHSCCRKYLQTFPFCTLYVVDYILNFHPISLQPVSSDKTIIFIIFSIIYIYIIKNDFLLGKPIQCSV